MPTTDFANAEISNYSNIAEHSIPAKHTDAATGHDEFEWINARWAIQWGYFNAYSDLKTAFLLKSIWIVGKGYTATSPAKPILDRITGWGKDTFRDILFNMDVTRRIGGDSFAEIIRNDDGDIINLKPLDPATIRIVVDKHGIIKRYEQVSKIDGKSVKQKYNPLDMFHLSNNRIADQIHGISDIDALERTILADDESFEDIKKLMHFQAKPFIVFKLKTDDATTIDNFISKVNNARKKGEDMFIPDDENVLDFEIIQVNPSQVILSWRDDIRNKFFRAIGLPQIVPGASGNSTESESKVIYTAFEQIVNHEQKYLEDQVFEQLGLRIDLEHPVSFVDQMTSDAKKDAAVQTGFQPNDIRAGVGR